ncbi:hypothetical protein PAXRUDRAFT_16027 [Paxillus rubicundulus Ve08.2h10]|uniref:Uncharacterized protein n=1 Tax=Paxillus rubicundulus Ve08.2h10 TaxID=930991 RepID=A0A0D0CWT8_9AGAM|nr:hypothetical protein PAXRUDRAFT_16027 [Paxillus rubicundulus Ve08.2h10]
MSLDMLPEPIQKAPVIYISSNTVLLDIDGVVPAWDVYTFSMDVQEPGQKQMILCVKKDAIKKRSVQTQTEDLENKEMFADMIYSLTQPGDALANHQGITTTKEELKDTIKLEGGGFLRSCSLQLSHISLPPPYPTWYTGRTNIKIYGMTFRLIAHRERESQKEGVFGGGQGDVLYKVCSP